jgi:hypothetical protein
VGHKACARAFGEEKTLAASGYLLNNVLVDQNVCVIFGNSETGIIGFESHSRYAAYTCVSASYLCIRLSYTSRLPILHPKSLARCRKAFTVSELNVNWPRA